MAQGRTSNFRQGTRAQSAARVRVRTSLQGGEGSGNTQASLDLPIFHYLHVEPSQDHCIGLPGTRDRTSVEKQRRQGPNSARSPFTQPRVPANFHWAQDSVSQSSCLSLPTARITGMGCLVCVVLGGTQAGTLLNQALPSFLLPSFLRQVVLYR